MKFLFRIGLAIVTLCVSIVAKANDDIITSPGFSSIPEPPSISDRIKTWCLDSLDWIIESTVGKLCLFLLLATLLCYVVIGQMRKNETRNKAAHIKQ